MNKKLLAIMIAATLLQGCTSFRQAENHGSLAAANRGVAEYELSE